MSIVTSRDGGVLIVVPGQRLDTNSAPEAEQRIASEIEQGETRILVDFGLTDYVSSAGLRVLLKATKQLKHVGGALALCNINPQLQEILDISGFAMIMPCYATVEEGLRSLRA
ncbi:STAS domain-containing protein [Methylolobus aquaticus]